jgi:hypothetical protein
MLFAIVSRGKKAGVRLYPHQFEDSRFGVSLTKRGPSIPLADHRDIRRTVVVSSVRFNSANQLRSAPTAISHFRRTPP